MRLISNGPDLPAELVKTQEQGEALFVCGAGVSRAAGLPSFRGLVEAVYCRLGESWNEHLVEREIMRNDVALAGQYDRVFRALERRLIGQDSRQAQTWRGRIRTAVRDSLCPSPDADLTDHLCLLALSRDAEHRNRLLTTNFDTLFERAWKNAHGVDLPTHACQAMPQPKAAAFDGVLHLHGRLADKELLIEETDLVLNSAEFGDAYLRNGWASRYLYDAARTHTLVLVGYGADDPPMRYLLEALEADRERFPDLKKIYAFAEVSNGDEQLAEALWRAKGIEPILYHVGETGSHAALYQTLHEWSRYADDPTAWRRKRLKILFKSEPKSADESEIAEVANLLSHGDADRLLGEISPDASWFPFLRKLNVFKNGNASGGPWIASRLGDPGMVRECASAPPSDRAWDYITQTLADATRQPTVEFRTAWRWINRARLAQHEEWRIRLAYIWNEAGAGEDDYGFRLRVIERTVPRLRVSRAFRWAPDNQPDDQPVTACSLVRVDFEVSHPLKPTEVLDALPKDVAIERRLLVGLCRALENVLDEAADVGFVGGFDQSSRDVPSIADHEQNRDRGDFLPMVRLIAEIWARLVDHDADQARTIAIGWRASEFALFQRFHLYAMANPSAFEPSEAVDSLLNLDDEKFWSIELRREAMQLMAERWSSFPAEASERVSARILAGPSRSMFIDDTYQNADEWRNIQDHWAFIRLGLVQQLSLQIAVSNKP